MATTTYSTPELTKRIQYNRENRDYDCFITIDGERQYIGSASTYSEGETKCNAYAYDYYELHNTPEVCAALVMQDDQGDPTTPAPATAGTRTEAERHYDATALSRPRTVAAPISTLRPITVERLYRDGPDSDLTEQPSGELAYVDYCIGLKSQGDHDNDQVFISFCVAEQIGPTDYVPPMVSLCGEEAQPLELVERAIANLQRLLADPRVRAARAAWEVSQRPRMRVAA